MSTEKVGANLRADDPEARSMAARMLGSARTERKIAAAKAVAEARRGKPLSAEHKAKLREVQGLRREREKAEREALGLTSPVEKKPVGRPRKQTTTEGTDAPKRGRGRPKKVQAGETLPMEGNGAENGTGGL